MDPGERMKEVRKAASLSYVCEGAQALVGVEAGRGG